MADIFGVRVTPELDTLNSLIICNKPGGQTEPAIVFNGENFIVVWVDARFPGITVARVTPQGVVLDTGNYIGGGSSYGEDLPDIACDLQRSFVVWSQEFYGVCGRFINNSAQPEGSVITIATTLATSSVPKVEFDNNNYLVVWADFCSTGTDLDIFGQMVSPQGSLISGKITIAQGPEIQNYSDFVFDGTNFIVVWLEESSGLFGQMIGTDGQLVGTKFRISDNTPYLRDHPSICVGIDSYLIVWGEYHDNYDIYGNIDIAIGIKEEESPLIEEFFPSIISGNLYLPEFQNFKVYDVLGRSVDHQRLKPGVYFVKCENGLIQKVVKAR